MEGRDQRVHGRSNPNPNLSPTLNPHHLCSALLLPQFQMKTCERKHVSRHFGRRKCGNPLFGPRGLVFDIGCTDQRRNKEELRLVELTAVGLEALEVQDSKEDPLLF